MKMENFLLKAFIYFECNLCYPNEFEVKCFTEQILIQIIISVLLDEKENSCSCFYNCCVIKNLKPITLNIPSNKLGINNYNEIVLEK